MIIMNVDAEKSRLNLLGKRHRLDNLKKHNQSMQRNLIVRREIACTCRVVATRKK